MTNLIQMAAVAVALVGGTAFAGELTCPAGSKLLSLQNDVDLMVSSCVKNGVGQGPMRMYFKSNGQTHAEGPVEKGLRTGHWVFFDKAGVKTAEIDFKNGDYHGLRVEFHPNGQKAFEEVWANGLLQVPAKRFDPAGKLVTQAPAAVTH